MSQSKHDKISQSLAKQEGVEYNKGEGPDIVTQDRVIEVATHESDLYSSLDQLSAYRKPKYIATTPDLIKKAKEITEDTGIGVMGPTGKIHKRSKRR